MESKKELDSSILFTPELFIMTSINSSENNYALCSKEVEVFFWLRKIFNTFCQILLVIPILNLLIGE